MICENVDFKFGLPVNISLNSLSQKKTFNRSFKLIWVLKGEVTFESKNIFTNSEELVNIEKDEIQLINSYTPFKFIKKKKNSKFLIFDFKNNYLMNLTFDYKEKVYYLNNKEDLSELKYLIADRLKTILWLTISWQKKLNLI